MQIFDALCNHVFPDDARIDGAMAKIGNARPLTPDEVRIYLKNDPGHGWIIPVGTAQIVVTLETPPVHTCAVRMIGMDGVIDEVAWQRLIAAAQTRAGGGFTAIPPGTLDLGQARLQVSGVQKAGAGGAAEAFYLIRTTPKSAAPAPRTDVEIRMVRQLIAPH